jgi:hypothetical protein
LLLLLPALCQISTLAAHPSLLSLLSAHLFAVVVQQVMALVELQLLMLLLRVQRQLLPLLQRLLQLLLCLATNAAAVLVLQLLAWLPLWDSRGHSKMVCCGAAPDAVLYEPCERCE